MDPDDIGNYKDRGSDTVIAKATRKGATLGLVDAKSYITSC